MITEFASSPATLTPTRRPGILTRRETEALFERWQVHGDHSARDELVQRFLPLARKLSRRYGGAREPFEDLLQVASLGLVKAVDRFDTSRGTAFSSFAVPTIMGEIKRYFRDSGWMVRPPRRLQELCLQLGATEASLEQRLHRPASVEELSFALGVTERQVRTARQAAASGVPVPLDAVVADDRPPPQAPWVDDPVAHLDDAWWLAWGLEELGPRERAILQLRFGESLTQADIAKRVGVSQIQVSRILRGILGRVRARLQSSLVAA
jgi:RNA polymerase sigma-B factor